MSTDRLLKASGYAMRSDSSPLHTCNEHAGARQPVMPTLCPADMTLRCKLEYLNTKYWSCYW
jgi:hypothetical protein